jgi:hypothetical protein
MHEGKQYILLCSSISPVDWTADGVAGALADIMGHGVETSRTTT